MSINASQEYLSIGGNRQTHASAWHAATGILAFGGDQNVALWKPLSARNHGIYRILKGHTDKVTAVAFTNDREPSIVSGSANGEIIIRTLSTQDSENQAYHSIRAHDRAINVVTTLNDSPFFVTGGADAYIKVWKRGATDIKLIHAIETKPRFIPLALAVGVLPNTVPEKGFFIIAAGTRNDIFVYVVTIADSITQATLQCSLTGHEGWIRSLKIRRTSEGVYMLASTSADKYIRLWRLQDDRVVNKPSSTLDASVNVPEATLTAKVKNVGVDNNFLSITFEALLLGHEDWVYSADWQDGPTPKLLTASADGTLAIWESDSTSGIWVSETRLGEISGQKGATTATGSSGGFWTGMWVSDGHTQAVVSLGRTGSWRLWHLDEATNFWNLGPGIGGHLASTNGICWSPEGEYLLSTSSDQTTRLHAQWHYAGQKSWHEFSRCQIHGYDCNVVTCVSTSQFVSGADEKLLRVFDEPKELADVLFHLCSIARPQNTALPETAAIPVLGLSNKEMGEPDDIIEAGPRKGDDDYAAASALAGLTLRGITEPPSEDLLSRHTLWPEYEKLYGHGYEISEASYKDGILATSCKASSIDHATIRLYDPINGWKQIEPPLTAHSLTITRLAWSHDTPSYLLSVGRDRQWAIFRRSDFKAKNKMTLLQAMPKAHSRMILDAAWAPSSQRSLFATAGRDKTVRLWASNSNMVNGTSTDDETPSPTFELCTTLTRPSAITAIDFAKWCSDGRAILATGEENGVLSVHVVKMDDGQVEKSCELKETRCLAKAVNRLAWRPISDSTHIELAIAGADSSVRILAIALQDLFADCE